MPQPEAGPGDYDEEALTTPDAVRRAGMLPSRDPRSPIGPRYPGGELTPEQIEALVGAAAVDTELARRAARDRAGEVSETEHDQDQPGQIPGPVADPDQDPGAAAKADPAATAAVTERETATHRGWLIARACPSCGEPPSGHADAPSPATDGHSHAADCPAVARAAPERSAGWEPEP